MNQKLINILLAAGLAVVLFLQFAGPGAKKGQSASVSADSTRTVKLAYVDLDSIQSNYLLYKEKMADFEKKKESADRDLNSAYQRIENERIAFAKRGESITQAEYENFQRSYQSKMQNLEQQKNNLEMGIARDGEKTMDELKQKINGFLAEYNKSHGYSYIFSYSNAINVLFYKDSAYDITKEVVEGLNAAYNKTAGKK
jgi:outer membrane protein